MPTTAPRNARSTDEGKDPVTELGTALIVVCM